MYNAEVYDYDAWGNPIDGWEVNDVCKIADVELANLDNETIIEKLVEIGYLREGANVETVSVVDLWPYLELEVAENGFPIGRVYIKED